MILDRQQRTAGIDSIFWREWQQHRDYLYRCCLRRMRGNQAEAEDILGMAMLRARESLRTRSTPIDNVKAWLVRLVNNLCTDFLKKRDRLEFAIDDELLVSQEEGPLLAATQQQLELFFEGEVNNLSPKLRQTFLLYWKEDLSYGEVAERLAISQSTARKRVSKARTILRERWNEYNRATEGSSPSLKTRRKSKGTQLQTSVEILRLREQEKLAADVEGTSADGLSVGEPASSRLGEAKRNPTKAPRRLGEAKRNPTRNAASGSSSRLGEVKRNPTRVNPAELRQKEELQGLFLPLPRGEECQTSKLCSLCISPEPCLKSKLRSSKLALVLGLPWVEEPTSSRLCGPPWNPTPLNSLPRSLPTEKWPCHLPQDRNFF